MELVKVEKGSKEAVLDAKNVHYKVLNFMIEDAINSGAEKIIIKNVNGHRYIADGVAKKVEIIIHGTPGDDLGAFMNGPKITVFGNAQDGIGNTMNDGEIIVHGDARDIVGHSMRGGKILVKGDLGYRVGIHMKQYREKQPVIVAGGSAGDFLGEYMAGGLLVLLGIDKKESEIAGDFIATGIHGGEIFIRGKIDESRLGIGAKIDVINEQDKEKLASILREFSSTFGYNEKEILSILPQLTKIVPKSHRPYGKLYTDELDKAKVGEG